MVRRDVREQPDRLLDEGVGPAVRRSRRPLDETTEVGGQIERVEPWRATAEGNRLAQGIELPDPEEDPPGGQKGPPSFVEVHVVETHPRRKAQFKGQVGLHHRPEVDEPRSTAGANPSPVDLRVWIRLWIRQWSLRHHPSVTKGCDRCGGSRPTWGKTARLARCTAVGQYLAVPSEPSHPGPGPDGRRSPPRHHRAAGGDLHDPGHPPLPG